MPVLVKSGSETTPLNELVIGFVQGTAGETRLKKYIDAHETKVERTLIDRLKDAHRNFPPMQSCSQQKLSPPIRSFSMRLRAAPLPVRPSPVLTAQDMRKIYLHTDLSAMKQVSAMSNMQLPQLRMNPPLLSLRNCSSMTCKKAVSLMHCLKIRTLIQALEPPRPSGFHPAQMHSEVFPAPCFHVSSGFDKTKRYSRLRKYRVIMYNLHAELILRTTEISACPKRQFLPVRTAERQRSFIQYGTV